MNKERIQTAFALIFFFFASFLFLSLICAVFINNFDNLLIMLFKQNGLFYVFTKTLLVIGAFVLVFLFITRRKRCGKRYLTFVGFGACSFVILLIISIATNSYRSEIENMVTLAPNYYVIINEVKLLIIDSVVFAFFIIVPLLNFFYKRMIYDRYFYQTYLKEITPSINVSLMFLFGYSIQVFDSDYYIIDLTLVGVSIVLFLRIAFSSRSVISIYTIVNLFVLIFGFCLFVYAREILLSSQLHPASSFFYALSLLYWFMNASLRLDENAVIE